MAPPRTIGDGDGLGIARALGRVEANQELQRKQLDDLDHRFDQAQMQRNDITEALQNVNARLDKAYEGQVQLTQSQDELGTKITGLDERVSKIEVPMQDALALSKYRRDVLRQVSIWAFSGMMFAWAVIEPVVRWLLTGVVKQWFGWN